MSLKKIGKISSARIFSLNHVLINNWCPDDENYSIYENGKIEFNNLIVKDSYGTNNTYFKSTNSIFLIETIIILEKLEKEKILYKKEVINTAVGKNIPIIIEKSEFNQDDIWSPFDVTIKSKLLFDILLNQYYIDEEKLKRFIKNKYKTEEERKEDNNNISVS